MEARKRVANQNDGCWAQAYARGKKNYGCVLLSPTAIVVFTVAILQQTRVKPSNIIAHEKGFKIHAKP